MTFEARGLRKELQGRTLYADLEFRVEPGQTLAVRGASGSGKSQLLRHLAGLDADAEQTQAGSIAYLNRDRDEWDPFQWRAEVCLIPQHVPRLTGTPAEFATRIASFREQQAREANDPKKWTERLGLSKSHWAQPWTELSIGERQRMLLAILLARRPGVLLLDEPTAALDQDSAYAVEEALADQTCIWITHSPQQAARVASDSLFLSRESDAD